jgi:hypothetical protein
MHEGAADAPGGAPAIIHDLRRQQDGIVNKALESQVSISLPSKSLKIWAGMTVDSGPYTRALLVCLRSSVNHAGHHQDNSRAMKKLSHRWHRQGDLASDQAGYRWLHN